MSTGENQGGSGGGDWQSSGQGNSGTGGFSGGQPPPPPPGQWGGGGGGGAYPPPGQQWGGVSGQPAAGAPVPNYLVWSILSTVLCCLPFGIVSIVYSTQVNSKQAAGDYQGALDSSRKAKTWAIASAVAGIVITIAALAFGFLGAMAGVESGSATGY